MILKISANFLPLAADIADPVTFFYLSIEFVIWNSAFVLVLLKGGDPTSLNIYRSISKLCILAKVFEKISNKQVKQYLYSKKTLAPHQSGFRKQHGTFPASLKHLGQMTFLKLLRPKTTAPPSL